MNQNIWGGFSLLSLVSEYSLSDKFEILICNVIWKERKPLAGGSVKRIELAMGHWKQD